MDQAEISHLTPGEPQWRKNAKASKPSLPPVRLAFWQLPVEGGRFFSGATGLNNSNTAIMSDRAPSILQRVRARRVDFMTVLEPYRKQPRVRSVTREDGRRAIVTLADGKTIRASLEELLGKRPVRR